MQEFINRINQKSNFGIRLWYLEELIKNTEDEKNRIEIEFKKNTNIDIINNSAVIKYVGISKLNKTALQEKFEKTGNKNIELIIKYRSIADKLSKFKGFYEKVNIETEEKIIDEIDGSKTTKISRHASINPIFKLNEKGAVTVSQPNIPFSMEQIQHIFVKEYAIPFNSLEEIIAFLKRYKNLFWSGAGSSTFLIINTTLYATMLDDEMDIMPFSFELDEEGEVRKLIKEFYNKYKKYKLVDVNFWGYTDIKQRKEIWGKDIAEEIEPKIDEKIEHEIEKDIKIANLEEKNEKNPEDIVDIKEQINHVAETLNKFNIVMDKLNAEKAEIKKEEEKKLYLGKMGNIELNYTKKMVLVNSLNLAELFFQSSNAEELKTNTFYFLSSLTTTLSNIDNYQFAIAGLDITASIDVELVETEETCTLTLKNGQLNII